jgi:uncharacterized protein (DUF305 family)
MTAHDVEIAESRAVIDRPYNRRSVSAVGGAMRCVVLFLTIMAASCTHRIVQPGIPGTSSRTIARKEAVDLSKVQFSAADVKFMQGMIHHHAQALDMTALIASRTSLETMKLLGQRIEISQSDEIRMMQRWLEVHGQQVPGVHDHHMTGATLMPGMLTPEEMETLVDAKGAEFDRLWLEGMIKHHDGALVMVEELFSTPGAAQESEVFAFATDVLADQKAEIDRMGAMLEELRNEIRH